MAKRKQVTQQPIPLRTALLGFSALMYEVARALEVRFGIPPQSGRRSGAK